MTSAPESHRHNATIRAVDSGDLDALTALEARCFGAVARSRQAVQDECRRTGSLALAAEIDQRIVGYALFLTVADEGELLHLAVDPAHRRRHLGRLLVRRGLASLDDAGVAVCHLEVRADARPARGLYEHLEFVPAGRRRRYYADGTDAILYRRQLR